jgi:hypothetical protein
MNKPIMKDPLDSVEAREEAWTEYSDAYKDINGFRPTGLKIIHDIFFNGTVKEYLQELDNIWNEYNVMMKKEINLKGGKNAGTI